MTDRVKRAVETYRNTGYNCAQSVLLEFASQFGMDRETALKIACGLGSGLGRSGNICGAVNGGILVLGLKFGMVKDQFPDQKEQTYEMVLKLLDKVTAIHGTTNCNELMGVDIGTPEGLEEARKRDLSEKVCAKVVGDVARILEELLDDGSSKGTAVKE